MPLRRALAVVVTAMTAGCTSLPSLDGREPSFALPAEQAAATGLGQTVSRLAADHPGKSGIYALPDPHEAFAVRALLIRAAQRTLDLQYYIWRNDLTGTVLLHNLYEAAQRGVRVRLLLDDNANPGMDTLLAALDRHPNFEVRLFNPLAIRAPRWINYLTDFSRINRRMHNKSFTVDNQVTVIGGRNIGDEYFGATADLLFSDLDLVAVGPAAQDVSRDFDLYWNSASAYPASLLLQPPPDDTVQRLTQRTESILSRPDAKRFVQALQASEFVTRLINQEIALEWVPTKLISDDPAKALGTVPDDLLMVHDLERYFGNPAHHMELVSAYFVPTRSGVQYLANLARKGIAVSVLTNSLAATDVAAVHAGYAKRRKPLVQAGIRLYEMRPQNDGDKRRMQLHGSGPGLFGSSGSSLHAKTLSIDSQRVFVGSFNFDPRSARLNTELGFVIDSPTLARDIHTAFEERIPAMAYELKLDDDGKLYWLERNRDGVSRHHSDPQASLWRRLLTDVLSRLPIEWML